MSDVVIAIVLTTCFWYLFAGNLIAFMKESCAPTPSKRLSSILVYALCLWPIELFMMYRINRRR